ncbi:hypothetical protein B0A81_16490 [Flavobacterium plurextorum]|uniref:Uncharacterized protein n=1 Tax=Flavobacterium plurextorum TaxID=1114867 RepID=A0ABX4CR65_9FLAO|nr:hypothetical protein [Flavobacterium plurextorum]OXB04761.1 hypothetical protein B0A81_16490 [Flavobacterium plurextorum]
MTTIFLYTRISSSLPWFFVICIVLIRITAYFIGKYQLNKLIKKEKTELNYFKRHGDKIVIRYDELLLKTNCWIENEEDLEKISDKISRNLIILEKTHRGHHFKIEYEIYMEPEILKMKLALKYELDFYYNSNNFDDNLLDFEFLFK